MVHPRHPRARLVRGAALLAVSALLAGACGGGPAREEASFAPGGAELEARAAHDRSAAEVIEAASDGLEIVNVPPALLGYDPPTGLAPADVAMVDGGGDAEAGPDHLPGDTDTDGSPLAGAGSAGPDGDAASGDTADHPGDDDPGVGDHPDADHEVAVELPEPPPAASGVDPLYDDPGELLFAASGRPFPTPAELRAGAAGAGVTRSSIDVVGIVSATLAGLDHRGAACAGARARYLQANAYEELSRRIDLTACHDDAGRSDLSEGLARAAVRSGTFAVAPISSGAFLAEDVLTDAAVPYVGADPLPAFCGRRSPFGHGTSGAPGCPVLDARGYSVLARPVLSALDAALDDGLPARSLALVEDGAAGDADYASLVLEADLAGLPVPERGPDLPTMGEGTPMSWRSTADRIVAAAPEVVLLHGSVIDGLPEAVRAAGFTGRIVVVGTVDPASVADPAVRAVLAPMTVVTPGLDLASRTSDGWRSMIGAAAAVGVGADEIDLDFVQGYVAADFLVRAVAATPEPLSGAALAATLAGGWWYPGIDGLACGSWWPVSHLIPAPCVSVADVDVFSEQLVPVVDLVETMPQIRFSLGTTD